MPDQFLKIVCFGLIGESKDGDDYRHVVFEDIDNGNKADYIIKKKSRPLLWSDVEEIEKGKSIPPRKGYITHFKGIEIVVLGDENLDDAYEYQKWKLDIQKRISFFKAEQMRKKSKGYCTDLTHKGAMEIGWEPIDAEARKVKFRYYTGAGKFSWSSWFQISG
ncbi:MAG: hypothetical protein JW894_03285 [Bacteroidales bacterium]|nr:hypothetical protein [Bacteroidales bacterium]